MSIVKFYIDELIMKGAYAEKYPGEPFDLTKATDVFLKDQLNCDDLEVNIQLINKELGDELFKLYGIDHPLLAFGSGRVDYRKCHYELWIDTNDAKKWTSRIFTNVTPTDVMGSSSDFCNETFGFFSHEFDESTDFMQILCETEAEAIKMIDMAIDKENVNPNHLTQ